MPSASTANPRKRRVGWWILLGLVLGVLLAFGLLLFPPVQAWLLRRALATQPETSVEFSRVALGPGGAEAADVQLRLPNITLEAPALRLAISPWQLLSRRRLAIADLQARRLEIRASTAAPKPTSTSTPFSGALADLKAPLAWACANAEADGFINLEQPGDAPIRVGFALKGRDLAIDRPGRLEFTLTAPGNLVGGFAGDWRLAGTLDFTPSADGGIERAVINGRLAPARSTAWWLPEIEVRVTLARSVDGETYELVLQPDATPTTLALRAAYARDDDRITGRWDARSDSALAERVLQRSDLPEIDSTTSGTFSLDTRTGDATAESTGTFVGKAWEKYLPELAQVGIIRGRHTAALARHQGEWKLSQLEASARSDGSPATFLFTAERPLPLPPGARDDTAPWGRLEVSHLPLGWTAPVLGVARVREGEAAGTWAISSPDAGTLRFTPLTAFASTFFTVEDPAFPALPPLQLRGDAHLDLTATTARLRVESASLTTERGDRLTGVIESVTDLDHLTAEVEARGTAQLPGWLGGAQAPVLHGHVTAQLREFDATVKTLRVSARETSGSEDRFILEWLSPFRFSYDRPEAIELAEGDLARFSARGLRLDWTAPLLPGFVLTGTLADGTTLVRREGPSLVVASPRPWEVRDLSVLQGGLPLLRAGQLTFAPAGRVQLGRDWTPGDFVGNVQLGGRLDEIFRLRDPAGPFNAEGAATLTRTGTRTELRSLHFTARRDCGTPLVELEALRPLALGAVAKNNDIDQAAESLRLRSAAIPLDWFNPLLPAGMNLAGTLEPAEFAVKIELPNLYLTPARPLAVAIRSLDDGGTPLLRDMRGEISPTLIVMGNLASIVIENGRLLGANREAGTLSVALMYFTNDLMIPITAGLDLGADIEQLRRQPGAATLPLPPTGKLRVMLDHDLVAGKEPTATVLLSEVRVPGSSEALPRLGVRLTRLKAEGDRPRARVDFQYQTAPQWSAFTAEFDFGMKQSRAQINTTVRGDYFDVARFLQLLEACSPTTTQTVPAAPAVDAKPATLPPAPPPSAAFWESLAGRFDLEFGAVAYDAYRIEQLRGEFVVTEHALDLRQLSGRMFDGEWSGRLRLAFDPVEPARSYALTGAFSIKDFAAERIVQAAYPGELGSFQGRLQFDSHLESRGAGLAGLLDRLHSEFSFHSDGGRLQLQVPRANVASAALLVGGAITFSPELRAMGRLITKLSDLPVEQLAAKGRRDPDGALILDDFRIHTPQLRLSAQGRVPPQPDIELAAQTFELPLTIAVRDEMAVILKGMKLIEKQPGADGFFRMTRHPTLRGTIGAPDTTELYDVLAHAASGSSGSFGFLMRKVQQEVEKTAKASALSAADAQRR